MLREDRIHLALIEVASLCPPLPSPFRIINRLMHLEASKNIKHPQLLQPVGRAFAALCLDGTSAHGSDPHDLHPARAWQLRRRCS